MTYQDMRNCLCIHRKAGCRAMFIVGIDIAKRTHEAVIITKDGKAVLKAFHFRNDCTEYNLLWEQVRKQTRVKSRIIFAMESPPTTGWRFRSHDAAAPI